MNSVKQLYELQLVDSEIEMHRNSLDELNSRIGESEQILAQKEKIAGYKEHLDDIRKRKKELEWDIDELTRTLSKLNEKLFSGKVKNPKELLDLEQDSKMHKSNLDKKEDGLLEILSDEEETDKGINRTNAELVQMEREWQESQKGLLEEGKVLEQKLAELQQQRDAVASGIDIADLKVYESVRARKGPAVSRIEQGRCQGCRLNLPMSQIQGARTGKLVQCTSCGRILYIG